MRATSLMPSSAQHARAIVRANGAPRGQRRLRGRELVRLVADQMRRELGLKPWKAKGKGRSA